MEEQMIERQTELQEASRVAINGIVYDHMQRIGDLVKQELDTLGDGSQVKIKVKKVLEKQQHVINSKMSAAFDEYSSQTQDLNKVYLDQFQAEAEKNFLGIKTAHKLMNEFATQTGVAKDGMGQEQLDAKIKTFYKNVAKKA